MIIGAGHAGVGLAAELRQLGFSGSVTLVNGEDAVPYHRPPLSKAWLKGEADDSSTSLRAADFYTENDIDLLTNTRITELDVRTRTARTSRGDVISFGDAVIATGATARPLAIAGPDSTDVWSLRDASDARRLKRELAPGKRIGIIGGGFIGLEVAATAVHLGAAATVIERDERLLSRVASEGLSEYLRSLHTSRGVDLRLGAQVTSLTRPRDGVSSVEIHSQTPLEFDLLLSAVGAIPDDRLARDAGVDCNNGVIVDADGQTSADHIYAIGDVASRPLPHHVGHVRLESVHNANEQARIVAAKLLGVPGPQATTPWFWSDQYDRKLQIVGLLPPERTTIERTDPDSGAFALFHLADGRLACVEAVNSSREFAFGRRAIAKGAVLDTAVLADPRRPLSEA